MRRLATAALVTSVGLLAAVPSALAVTGEDFRTLGDDAAGAGPAAPTQVGSGTGLGRMLFGLIAVLALVFVVYWVLRRLAQRTPGVSKAGPGLEVISTTPIGPNRTLHLVRVGGEVLLLGATEGGGVRTLHRLDHLDAVTHGLLEDDALTTGILDDDGRPLDEAEALLGAALGPRGGLLDSLRDRTAR